jgi:hypothetical protein
VYGYRAMRVGTAVNPAVGAGARQEERT